MKAQIHLLFLTALVSISVRPGARDQNLPSNDVCVKRSLVSDSARLGCVGVCMVPVGGLVPPSCDSQV